MVQEVANVADLDVDTGGEGGSGTGTQWGTGGMATKLTAARIACAAGCTMAICNSKRPDTIERIVGGDRCGTVFRPLSARVADKKRWILTGTKAYLKSHHCKKALNFRNLPDAYWYHG